MHAAGTSVVSQCGCCEKDASGNLVCVYWETFREEAKAAIIAMYKWNKKERRWPSFCKGG